LYPLPEFSNVGKRWDCRKFCGKIEFDRKRLPFFGRNASSWESWKTMGPRRKNSADFTEISRAGADKISILWKRALNIYFAFSSNSCYTIYRRLGEKPIQKAIFSKIYPTESL